MMTLEIATTTLQPFYTFQFIKITGLSRWRTRAPVVVYIVVYLQNLSPQRPDLLRVRPVKNAVAE